MIERNNIRQDGRVDNPAGREDETKGTRKSKVREKQDAAPQRNRGVKHHLYAKYLPLKKKKKKSTFQL